MISSKKTTCSTPIPTLRFDGVGAPARDWFRVQDVRVRYACDVRDMLFQQDPFGEGRRGERAAGVLKSTRPDDGTLDHKQSHQRVQRS
jgi:hypothetical protein